MKSLFALFISLFTSQILANPIVNLLEDNLLVRNMAWIVSEIGTPTWTSTYQGPGWYQPRSTTRAEARSSLPTKLNNGAVVELGNTAWALVESDYNYIFFENNVHYNYYDSPIDFIGVARSEIAYNSIFQVVGGDIGIGINAGLQYGTSLYYSLYDETLDMLLIGGFNPSGFHSALEDNHIYHFSMYSSLESSGDPFGPYLQLSFDGTVVRAVPEPSAAILLGVGLVGLGFSRKLKKA